MLHPISSLRELDADDIHCTIINCGTKLVSSLALLSLHRYANFPVTIIDCESKDGSRGHFDRLARELDLECHWLEWPLRPHPAALDRIFREIPAKHVLLCDSDVELLSADPVQAMRDAVRDDPLAFGAGFVHGPEWLGEQQGLLPCTGYYAKRMWIPLVMLRTSAMRRMLEDGASFTNQRFHAETPGWPAAARLLNYRHRIRGLRRWRVPSPRVIRGLPGNARTPTDPRPYFVEFDTGAALHARLEQAGFRYAAVDDRYWGDVRHHHGVTRAALIGRARRFLRMANLVSNATETRPSDIAAEVRTRLREVYGVPDDMLAPGE